MTERRAKQHISYHMPDMINILFLISKRQTTDAFVSFMTFQYRGKNPNIYTVWAYMYMGIF